jgi:hypothetical protein
MTYDEKYASGNLQFPTISRARHNTLNATTGGGWDFMKLLPSLAALFFKLSSNHSDPEVAGWMEKEAFIASLPNLLVVDLIK